MWYWCYYRHQSKDALSPICGIFFFFPLVWRYDFLHFTAVSYSFLHCHWCNSSTASTMKLCKTCYLEAFGVTESVKHHFDWRTIITKHFFKENLTISFRGGGVFLLRNAPNFPSFSNCASINKVCNILYSQEPSNTKI